MARFILSAFLMCGILCAAAPSSALAREATEKPKQQDKHKPGHGGKHKDDGPRHK